MFGHKKVQKTAVSASIINENNQLLIVKRAKDDSRPGVWELPGGGIEFGENPQDAIIREVKEETGLDVFIFETSHAKSIIYANGNKHLIRIFYICGLVDTSQQVVLNKEHSDFQWIDFKEIQPSNHFLFN